MRTVARVAALLPLAAVVAHAGLVLTDRHWAILAVGAAILALAPAAHDHAVTAVVAAMGGLYLAALFVGVAPTDTAAPLVAVALLAYVELSALAEAAPEGAAAPPRTWLRLGGGLAVVLVVGAALGWAVLAGRELATRPSALPWLAGTAAVLLAVVVPALLRDARDRRARSAGEQPPTRA